MISIILYILPSYFHISLAAYVAKLFKNPISSNLIAINDILTYSNFAVSIRSINFFFPINRYPAIRGYTCDTKSDVLNTLIALGHFTITGEAMRDENSKSESSWVSK